MSADIHKYGLGPKVLVSHLTCIILVSRVYREPVLCCTDLETTGGIRYLLVLTGLEDCMALPLWAVPDQGRGSLCITVTNIIVCYNRR